MLGYSFPFVRHLFLHTAMKVDLQPGEWDCNLEDPPLFFQFFDFATVAIFCWKNRFYSLNAGSPEFFSKCLLQSTQNSPKRSTLFGDINITIGG